MYQLGSKTAIYFSVLVVILLPLCAKAERSIAADDVNDKMRGMWLGQLIGNMAGRDTEGDFDVSYPNPDPCVPWVINEIWDGDDDTDIEYIAIHILETEGFDCNSSEIADQWRSHSTSSGLYISNLQAWYLMGDGFVPPETGNRTYNEHWYSIDSQITTETLGAVSCGLVQSAVDLSGKFAHITNEGLAVHAAQFYAAMYANAFFADSNDANMVGLVEEGLKAIPTTSRTYEVISDVLNWYLEDANDGELDWRATRCKLYDYYEGAYDYGRYYLWIESTINTGATVLAILYGQADFKETVQIGILAGWDCDCNPATAGGLIGIIGGYSGLPNDLTDPNICGNVYKNVYRPYLPDPNLYRPQYDTITNIASRLTALAERNILDNGGYITGSGPTKTYHIPDNGAIVGEPEKGDPDGPTGLVAEALDAAITVTTSAAVEYHYSTSDRRNLDSIINGITDNSYNGHRAYYSYLYDPNARPELDWYQLNFSQPVKFETMTFYEGDVVWSSINTYYINDDTSGGFFNDLTLEILRDGRFIEPANLEMSPALDRFKMYQTITFTFSPTVGDAIRIIGTAGGTRNYTTIMELAVTGDIDPGLYVAAVEIANDQLQRSSVAEVAVAFSNDVTITPDDIELAGTTNGTGFSEDQINFIYDSFSYQLTLEFDMDNDANFGDSLPDDTYQLRLDCNCITDPCSQTLLDDDSDPEDGFYTIEFHALYGDADGSAVVDLSDLALLGGCWLDNAGDTGLDWNADNIVSLPDMAHFADNWLSWFTY